MGNSTEDSEQHTAEEKELARQAKKYLEDHDCWLSVSFDEYNPPSKEVKEFLFNMPCGKGGMSGFDVALSDAEAVMTETLIEAIEIEWLAEETEV